MKKARLLLPVLGMLAGSLAAQYPGDLIITEFMAHSQEVPDEYGEYIELFNTTFYAVNLNGCVIQDASNLYVAPAEDVWVEPGEFAAIGRSAVPYAHYYFPASPPPFNLNNTGGDQITVTCGGTLVAGLTYNASQTAGVAMELASTGLHTDGITQEADYSPSTFPFRYLGVTTTDYGTPGYAGSTYVLPVTLSYFGVQMEGNRAVLRWITETEQNNSHFIVEHSTDARLFQALAVVPGAGTTTERREYTYTHDSPGAGLHYYRLRQVDYDGTATLSPLRSVDVPGAGAPMRLYPTTATDALTLELEAGPDEAALLAAFNLHGRQVAQWRLPPGNRYARLDISALPGGHYFLHLQRPTSPPQSGRFVKR